LSSNRGVTERLKPPRALYCEFPLGRPLGVPGDAAFQRRVLDAAFALLERPLGPVLEDFPDKIDDVGVEPVACPVPPRFEPSLPEAVDEANALGPAYDRQLKRTGRTAVGKVLNPDQVPEAVAVMVRLVESGSWQELSKLGNPRLVAQDIRGYYEEAAMELSDHTPAAHAAEAWFYQETATGRLMLDASRVMRDGGAPQPDWSFLVPRNFQP
jgi:hypothetical protein